MIKNYQVLALKQFSETGNDEWTIRMNQTFFPLLHGFMCCFVVEFNQYKLDPHSLTLPLSSLLDRLSISLVLVEDSRLGFLNCLSSCSFNMATSSFCCRSNSRSLSTSSCRSPRLDFSFIACNSFINISLTFSISF